MGVLSFVVGSQCLLIKSQSMQKILAPLSTRVQVSIAFMVCEGCYSPTLGTTFFNGLVIFLSLILSYLFRLWTMRRFSMRTHLSHTLHTFTTCVCLMANLMPSNLTLFLTVHFHAVHGYAITHIHITHVYAFLLFCHCHAVAICCSYLDMSFSDSINRFGTNMYIYYDSI